MAEQSPLELIKAISDPAKILIEKISDAIGGIFEPWQIRRVAEAEAEANLIRAKTDIEIDNLQIRSMERFFIEEARKQYNIESITAKALNQIDDSSNPKDMDEDWIVNFFDKSRLISDEEMQILWSQILAGEANSPGSFSNRTVNFVSSLSKNEAKRFKDLCRFICNIPTHIEIYVPLIIHVETDIYRSHDGTF